MQRKLYQPTLLDVIDYLSPFNMVCDVCHHAQWTVYIDQDQKTTIGAMNRLTDNSNGEADFRLSFNETCTPVIQVQCKHCGQLKFFGLPHVLNAIERSKEEQK